MMTGKMNPIEFAKSPTRRQCLAGAAVTLGALVTSSVLGGKQQAMTEKQSTGSEATRTYLHQEIDLKASPQKIYEILLDSKQFAAFTGMPAEISREPGGAFSMFGGMIVGRSVELVANQRIVQAWRPGSWDPGVYSIVRFELKGDSGETKLILDHTGFPEGDFAHLDPGWYARYWNPLKKYLS
ncbi:MAG: SRPBCC family protein [Candidatus Acidiferrales bacterium]|jgi:activator of HSP90 ATPase